MSDDPNRPAPGTVGWIDLTVPDATGLRDFYQQVVGWEPEALDMGGYSDFVMKAEGGQPVTGVCHARGNNSGLPAQWLIYVVVRDLDQSLERCLELGGRKIGEVRSQGPDARYCIIQDPAGAVAALYEAVRPSASS